MNILILTIMAIALMWMALRHKLDNSIIIYAIITVLSLLVLKLTIIRTIDKALAVIISICGLWMFGGQILGLMIQFYAQHVLNKYVLPCNWEAQAMTCFEK